MRWRPAAVVASSPWPVTEIVTDSENGRLLDFLDRPGVISMIEELLEDPAQRDRLGRAARETVVAR